MMGAQRRGRGTFSPPSWGLDLTGDRLPTIKRANKFIVTDGDKCNEGNRLPLGIHGLSSDCLGLNFGREAEGSKALALGTKSQRRPNTL